MVTLILKGKPHCTLQSKVRITNTKCIGSIHVAPQKMYHSFSHRQDGQICIEFHVIEKEAVPLQIFSTQIVKSIVARLMRYDMLVLSTLNLCEKSFTRDT